MRALLRLFVRYLRAESEPCRERGIRLNVIGRRDRLPEVLRRAIESAELATASGRVLQPRIAIDYSARDAIVAASARAGEATRASFAARLAAVSNACGFVPDVDLVIRTGGEQRLATAVLYVVFW